jgi:polyisoprenoid-binding protein YceI
MTTLKFAASLLLFLTPLLGGQLNEVAVTGGLVTFQAETNVSALTVHGKSSALEARVQIQRSEKDLILEKVDAVVSVQSLSTGMSIRDRHMRERVMADGGGSTPDLRFTASKTVCGLNSECSIKGDFLLRGVARPMTITSRIREESGKYRVTGTGTLKLSDYGIEPPSQLGVRVKDEVSIKFDFTALEKTLVALAEVGR